MPDLEFTPFPQPRSPGGVSGGPLAVLTVLLAGAAALLALTVLDAGPWPAWWVPAGLVLVAGVVHALLWFGLVRPVRRFGAAMARMAVDDRVDLVPRARAAELDRAAVALYRFRRVRPGRRADRPRQRVWLAVAPALAAVLVLSWAVPAAVATVGGVSPQVDALTREARSGAAQRAAELDAALREGLTAVERVADPPTGAVIADPGTAAAQVLAAEPLFRSVTVVDASGAPVATAGPVPAGPLAVPPGPARIVQANSSGAEPLVRAASPMWDGTSALVAEFDPRALGAVIRTPGVHTQVVDARRATVLDSVGYQAFAPLADATLAALAATAASGAPAVGAPDPERVAAAQRVGVPESVTDLGWVLVEDQDVAAAAFAGDGSRRGTLVAVVLAAGLAVAALAWTLVTVVGPARRLARHVEQLADGEAPPPLAPQRLDEIGTAVAATNRMVAVGGSVGA